MLGAREPAIFAITKLYILGYLAGLPFFTLIRILAVFFEMEGQYYRINAISIMTSVIDIAADAFVVFVLHGGMFEIGLATSFGYIVPFFVGAAFFVQKKSNTVFRLSIKEIGLKLCGEIMRLGTPSGAAKLSCALGGMLINNMLTATHTRYLVAAYGVFSQITVFARSAWFASTDTLQSFVGIFIGEEDRDSLKEVQKISLSRALAHSSMQLS